MNKNKFKIFGTLAMVIGAIASVASSLLDRKQTEAKIDESVQKHLAEAISKQATEG